MKKNLALLFADLSGYTAMTETHGAVAAADLIDDYLDLVKASLSGNVRLHQVIGDEVVLVSESATDIFRTCVLLHAKCMGRHNFLQVHGGMHYGEVLVRNDNFFGNCINFTSRVAKKSIPGQFLCTAEFLGAINDDHSTMFRAAGKFNFKNVKNEIEIFELVFDKIDTYYIDPVCRMFVNPETALQYPGNKEIFFCSPECMNNYIQTSLQSSVVSQQ